MIQLTDAASRKIKQSLIKRGTGIGIRLGVRTTGCSGLAFVLEYVDTANPEDIVHNSNECIIVIDPKSMSYLNGLTIDYVKQGLNEGFEFRNPNERDRCGCGESFRI